jgi:hypothetical protein
MCCQDDDNAQAVGICRPRATLHAFLHRPCAEMRVASVPNNWHDMLSSNAILCC